jgi:hypothetical protein
MDWIDKELKRQDADEEKRIVARKVKCALCDRSKMWIKDAKVTGPLCPACRERVRREGRVKIPGTEVFIEAVHG